MSSMDEVRDLDADYFNKIIKALLVDCKENGGRITDSQAGAIVRGILDDYLIDIKALIQQLK